ncbi:alpha/beta fold hydrolase [Taibaiella koreensis]|uniref:alpha/beta fold hydrolase n=1 Tax=Taibaiella koreensis TaxID=1268548 RepID=UPI0013C2FFE0|nr:alpha/beta hydrolase [Taibaiella koreensis]
MSNLSNARLPEPGQKTIYLFSGLGADYHAFGRLSLPGYHLVYIRWIRPEKGESMAQYAGRLRSQITVPRPILIGLSFGGMIAVEVAKQLPAEKIVLISSAKTRSDLAAGANFFFKWKLYRYIPGQLLQQSNFIVNKLFGAETASDKEVLGAILEDTDVPFFRWAMDNIVHWDNETIPPHLIHIHGTADRIIPFSAVKADYAIEGGGHLMVLNRADTISRIILDFLHS